MRVQRRRAVRGERRSARFAQRGGLDEAGDAEAARGVGLQDVDGVDHLLEVQQLVAVFAGGDVHRKVVAQGAKAIEVI